MSATKKCSLLLCLCLILTSCTKHKEATQELYTEALTASGTASYNTTQVIKGDFEKEESYKGSVYLPATRELNFQSNGQQVIFDSFLVSKGDTVKKGTPIACFTLSYDKVVLTEKELSLKRTSEDYENKLTAYKKEISDARKAYQSLPDGYDKAVEKINLQKKEIEFEQYQYNTEISLAQLKKDLETYKSSISKSKLCAPMDGIVGQLDMIKEGDIIHPEDVLATVYSLDQILFKANDANHSLRYNQGVSLVISYKGKEYDARGRVISDTEAQSEAGASDQVIIEAQEKLTMDVDWAKVENIRVKAATVSMKDVLLVENGALTWDNKAAYVKILDGESIHKRSVIIADDNSEYCWVVKGVEEGQTLIMR